MENNNIAWRSNSAMQVFMRMRTDTWCPIVSFYWSIVLRSQTNITGW